MSPRKNAGNSGSCTVVIKVNVVSDQEAVREAKTALPSLEGGRKEKAHHVFYQPGLRVGANGSSEEGLPAVAMPDTQAASSIRWWFMHTLSRVTPANPP